MKPPSPARGTFKLPGFFSPAMTPPSFIYAGESTLLPEEDRGPRLHQTRHGERVPVGEPDAAMGEALSDHLRHRPAMDAVVLFGDVDPDHSHRVSRAGWHLRFGLGGIGVPEQGGVVIEGRIEGDSLDL